MTEISHIKMMKRCEGILPDGSRCTNEVPRVYPTRLTKCFTCKQRKAAEWRAKNRDTILARGREYYKKKLSTEKKLQNLKKGVQ